MPKRTSKTGSELFIVDNSDDDWKVLRYLHDSCGLSLATARQAAKEKERLSRRGAGGRGA